MRFKKGFLSTNGRNFLGRICINGRGGGFYKFLLKIDYFRRINSFGFVLGFLNFYFSQKSFFYAFYDNGLLSIMPAVLNLNLRNRFYSGIPLDVDEEFYKNASSIPLSQHILFTQVSNLEILPFKGALISRAPGSSSTIVNKVLGFCELKLNSGWKVILKETCIASVGLILKFDRTEKFNNKASKSRVLGFKPKVRGVAKNPCDHPHGGGNGKKSNPPVPVNFNGRIKKWTPSLNTKFVRNKRFLFKDLIKN